MLWEGCVAGLFKERGVAVLFSIIYHAGVCTVGWGILGKDGLRTQGRLVSGSFAFQIVCSSLDPSATAGTCSLASSVYLQVPLLALAAPVK